MSSIVNSGRNVTVDRYFTSLDLEQRLKVKGLTLVGPVNANRNFLPLPFVCKTGREQFSSKFGFNDTGALLSFMDRSEKVVLLLSTRREVRHTDIIPGHVRKLPKLIDFYNHTKNGVDLVDRMKSQYSVVRISRRWTLMAIFFNSLSTYITASR